MKEVILKPIDWKLYRNFLSLHQVKEMRSLAVALQGRKFYFINSTSFGGGVAEIFHSAVPLIRSLGIDLRWYIIEGDEKFFAITKKLHNLLQGGEGAITPDEIQYYLGVNKKNAADFTFPADLVVIHDPQPMPLPLFILNRPKLIWRCHIDTAHPNLQAKKLVQSFLPWYDKAIFSLDNFARGLEVRDKKIIIYPSIDPLSSKNKHLKLKDAQEIVRKFGVNLRHPFLLQVSRFDPWKDPLGVVKVYQELKKEFPKLQLVLIGSLASDDPEGQELYRKVKDYTKKDKDIFVFTNLDGVGNTEVNAFQRLATVVLQKSIREGFGLTVSEALWKKRAVIGGSVGGITHQIHSGHNGYLIRSDEGCRRRIRELLLNRKKRRELGEEGFREVKNNFLLPRYIFDYLHLFNQVINPHTKQSLELFR